MPRPSKVDLETALTILTSNFSYFEKGFPPHGDPAWKVLAQNTKDAWTPHCWWVNVTKNRRDLWTLARERLGLASLDPQTSTLNDFLLEEELENEETDSESDELNNSELREGESWFDFVISSELWQDIKPCDMDGTRKKYSLRAKVWTSSIRDEFYRQFRLPCAFVFRRGEVFVSGASPHFLKMVGRCRSTSCGNKFYGIADKAPCESTGDLLIRVKTQDTVGIPHEVIKCPLNGKKRGLIGRTAVGEGSNNLKKRLDRQHLRRGEVDAPTIPSTDQIRHAKKEAVDEQLGIRKEKGESVFDVIERMKFRHPFMGSIHDLGKYPFFVIYGTSEQTTLYKLYRRTMKTRCSVSIDSTSTVMRALKRPLGQRGAAIFLYIITIHFDKSSISLFQMLSECQEAEKITMWLRVWLRVVGWLKPSQVVVDYSPTMLASTCIAFNEINIKNYIQICFHTVSHGEELREDLVATFIRVDIAHFVKAICDWLCLKNHPIRRVPEFFIRCMTLMADSQKFADLIEVYSLMCIVALHQFDDTKVRLQPTRNIITVADARGRLINMMAKRPRDINGYLELAASERGECKIQDEDIEDSDDIVKYFSKLKEKAESIIELGSQPNFYYLPEFIDSAQKKMVQFPVWSAVCLPYYADHATSSYVERTFRDIKNEMTKNYQLPLDGDRFLAVHLQDLIGGTRSFTSQLLEFRMNGNRVPEPIPKISKEQKIPQNNADKKTEYPGCFDDSGLKSNENWRGKAESFTRIRCPNLDSTQYSEDHEEVNESSSKSPLIESPKESYQDTSPGGVFHSKDEETIILETPSPTHSHSGPDKFPKYSAFEGDVTLPETPTKTNQGKLSPTRSSSSLEESPSNSMPPGSQEHSNQRKFQDDIRSTLKADQNRGESPLKESPVTNGVPPTKRTKRAKRQISFNKSPPQGKYSRDYPEGVFNEVTEETIEHQKKFKKVRNDYYLLKNAFNCGNLKINGQLHYMRNTCAFDSLVSILAMAAMDDPKYFNFMETTENALFEFIIDFLYHGATPDIYLKRFLLLQPHFEHTASVKSMNQKKVLTSYDATSSPADIWTLFFQDVPSVFRSYKCDDCKHEIAVDVTMFVNHRIVSQKGFGSLEKALGFYPEIHNTICHCGKNTILEYDSNLHILIELDIRINPNALSKSVSLDDIPKKLQMRTQYRLVGLVHREDNHFIAYCLRQSGRWEEYSDTQKTKSSAVDKTKIVTPMVAIYIMDHIQT